MAAGCRCWQLLLKDSTGGKEVISVKDSKMSSESLVAVVDLYSKQGKLKEYLAGIREQVEREQEEINKKLIVNFVPYLLEIYNNWRPKIGEIAMLVDFEGEWCCEVEIKEINGYDVLANRVAQKHVSNRFELNPSVNNYKVTKFVLPMRTYDELDKLIKLNKFGVEHEFNTTD